jgi:phosphate-selective porin
VGQSKVPYGFENLQSSSNRLALDRNDALNSAVRDERDLGAFYYYTPTDIQALFEDINKQGLKHSGNYGMFALGLYNGQGANRPEQNDNYHVVSRFTYPWKAESGQIFEAGIQAYRGEYVSSTAAYSRRNAAGALATATPTLGTGTPLSGRNGIEDERVGISFIMYPQPFGIQAEWNWGNTPGLDIAKNVIEKKSLNGGYVQAMYKIDNFQFLSTNGTLIPFIKWQYFDGYNKAETNSPENHVNDWELGVEWQLAPEVEIAMVYHRMNRTNLVTGGRNAATPAANLPAREDYEHFKADALRVQLQYNF